MKNKLETWRDIPGYEGLYQVSSLGRVRSLKYRQKDMTRILKQFKDGRAYFKVKLCTKGKEKTVSVHRLVAIAFIPNPLKKREVNHINGNTEDNSICNLEWVTPSENMKHAVKIGHVTSPIIKSVVQLTLDGRYIKTWESARKVSLELGLDSSTITKCCKRKLKSCGGYHWKYSDMEATYLMEKKEDK